ncbi:MAG: acyltransferase family protein [Parvularculaceae bacterium]
MSARLQNIQALRGVAALIVLAAHIKDAELDYGGAGPILPFALYVGVIGVDLFFLISGFVMAHVALDGSRGAGASARFLYNRAARIFPIYWAVTLCLLALYAGKQILFSEPTPFPNPVATFFLLPDDQYPLLPVGWTLVHEMFFYAVFAVFVLWRRTSLLAFLGLWAAIVMAGNIAGLVAINPWTKVLFSPLTFEFIAGALIAILVRRGTVKFARSALIGGGAAALAIAVAGAASLYPAAFADPANRVAIFTPPFALMLYGAAALETKSGSVAPRWLRSVGDASYSLYLIHVPVLLVAGKLISVSVPDGAFDNPLLVACFLAASLAAAFALHAFVEKPALSFTRKLGGRLFRLNRAVAGAGVPAP